MKRKSYFKGKSYLQVYITVWEAKFSVQILSFTRLAIASYVATV